MAEKITCVNGNVLKWARMQCGNIKLASIQELLPQIERWENGEDFPTYAQLEKLANAYQKPIAVFFFPSPPEGISYQAEFRTTSDTEISLLSHKVTRLINEALVMQINIRELTPNMKLAEHVLHNKLRNISGERLELDARNILNVSIEKQLNANSPKAMLDIWRNAFFAQGIYVFKEAFHDENISGFCIYDNQVPIIYLRQYRTEKGCKILRSMI